MALKVSESLKMWKESCTKKETDTQLSWVWRKNASMKKKLKGLFQAKKNNNEICFTNKRNRDPHLDPHIYFLSFSLV